jgi:aconitate hydratase
VSIGRDSLGTLDTVVLGGVRRRLHRLDRVAADRLPFTFKVLLENLLRHEDGELIRPEQIDALLNWNPAVARHVEVDLHASRIFLHDTNGVPTLVDLAALRDAMQALGGDPSRINPLIPAELVTDHSVIADYFGRPDARDLNVDLEYERNSERYRFLKWGQGSFDRFKVVPPGMGIMHQVNIEYLARVVETDGDWAYPDLCLGTDSHTTMVNGLGVLGWGIGGIEAEAVMLGQPLSLVLPEVLGFRLTSELPPGATATDLVLTVTQMLRRHGVVGKFVEFHGPGVARTSVADRVTIANMSPEFGSTCAVFPIDGETLRYLRFTGRNAEHVALVEAYAKTQGLWHEPDVRLDYSEQLELDLATVVPSLAGPHRPQDRVPLTEAKTAFLAEMRGTAPPEPAPSWVDEASEESFPASDAPAIDPDARCGPSEPDPAHSFGRSPAVQLSEAADIRSVEVRLAGQPHQLRDGAVAIAAITSCTNTSNPQVMVAAGLLARNAARRGLTRRPWVKTTLSPGSKVVVDYLREASLMEPLETLGFHLAGFGCMTCIGASGPLIEEVSAAAHDHDLTVVSVLSGNRNFEGRINPDVKMNYLASPPLVVAYALAGHMDIDLSTEPLATDREGLSVYLADLWPTKEDIDDVVAASVDADMFHRAYTAIFDGDHRWRALQAPSGDTFAWAGNSTYIRRPPHFDHIGAHPGQVADIEGARVLVKLGDSVTTDHISPAGVITPDSDAGRYLTGLGVSRRHLNTFASRRGNHEVMVRGTFANVRLRNQVAPGTIGGLTRCFDADGAVQPMYQAATAYRANGTPLVVIAGKDYGAGSSRDWAAKGPKLLGVRAVLAESFERIHRSNLIGMAILPLQFLPGETAASLGLSGTERISVNGIAAVVDDPQRRHIDVRADDRDFRMLVRLDTRREADYYRHGGVLPYVLRTAVAALRE